MELIHSGYLVDRADGPPSFPYKTFTPEAASPQRFEPLPGSNTAKIAVARAFHKILCNKRHMMLDQINKASTEQMTKSKMTKV
jgi:hypothetical protein